METYKKIRRVSGDQYDGQHLDENCEEQKVPDQYSTEFIEQTECIQHRSHEYREMAKAERKKFAYLIPKPAEYL